MRLKILLVLLGIAIGLLTYNMFLGEESDAKLVYRNPPGSAWTALDKYLPKNYSWKNEELIIRHFFNDRPGGFFLDVGAYHYMNNSNTYYLEKNLGWSGLAIDAIGEFEQGYLDHRPRTRFFNFFVSNESNKEAEFYVVKDPKHVTKSSALKSHLANLEKEKIQVPTITLNDLLEKLEIEKIDFFTIDIELWEPQALAGFDIKRFLPELVCIEAHKPVQEKILRYFSENEYVRLDQYLLLDQYNWYFVQK